nr:glycosyltransferase family 4 protein [Salipaludibacillus aurantiacus]
MKGFFQVGVIQPGEIKNPISGAHFYHLTSYTRIKHLIKHPFSFLSYILKVRKILRNQNPSVVHTQAQVSFFIVALLKKFKLISKDISFIHTERGLYTKYNKIIKQIFHFFLKELDVLVTTTEFNMRYWKNAIQSRGMNLECKVIENTAGELFETYNERFHKINTGSLVIGFAGRYTEWKNWPLAVEICKLLNKELKDKLYVKFAVGCLDEWSKVETKKMFDDLYKVLGNRFEGVINIDLKEMNNFYYELDVFILTSNYNTESFGRTLVEAMSRRTVVLTTDAGGSVEVVGNKDNVCVTSNDFVDRVLDFYKNKKLMEDEKENNHSRVKQKYSLKNNLDKHFNLYNKINYKKNDLYFLNK